MEDLKEKRLELKRDIEKSLNALSEAERDEKSRAIAERLFGFANFLEARIVLLYLDMPYDVRTDRIIKKSFDLGKIVVLPANATGSDITLLKIGSPDSGVFMEVEGIRRPDPYQCHPVPIDCIDIAIIPGLVFDEKGGRIGASDGLYTRMIPKLPITTRKVALAYEEQILQQVPMEHNDRFVDIIISDKRIIYKI